MIKNITKSVLGAAGSFSASLSHFSINGLVLSKNKVWHASDKLTVSLSSPFHAPVTLVPGIPVLALAGISDIEAGYSHPLQAIINTLNTGTDYGDYSCYVDLGCLRNQENQSVLEIRVDGGEAATWSVAAMLTDVSKTDEVVRYIWSSQTSNTVGQCEALYLFAATAMTAPSAKDISLDLTGDFGASHCIMMDVAGASLALGQTESGGAGVHVFAAYRDPMPDVVGPVTYTLTGADVADVSVIGKTIELKSDRVSRATIRAGAVLEQRLRRLPVDVQKAYERAGRAPSLVNLGFMIRNMNVK